MSKTTQKNAMVDAILAQYESSKPKERVYEDKKFGRDELMKKFFNPYLRQGQKTGEFTFRILPTEDGSPFVEAHFHVIKVNGKWEKLYCPKHNDDEHCPICEAEEALRATGTKEDKELSKTYRASKFYIVKGIDRDNEADGVKYYRFKHNYKQQGAFDKIIPIFAKKGDITDPNVGYDLIISCGRDDKNNSVVTSIMPDEKTKLSEDQATSDAWVSEDSTWRDVFRNKGEDFLQAVVEGRAPYWDDSTKKYVTPGKETNSNNTTASSLVKPSGSTKAPVTKNSSDLDEMNVTDDLPF